MRALTADRPKPLIRVGGKTLIDHALDVAYQAGVTRPVINLHYKGEQIEAHLSGASAVFSHEAGQILDTGGGLKAALPLLPPGPIMTLNSDAVWFGANPLTELAAAWNGAQMDTLLLLMPLEEATGHHPHADFHLAADGRISRGRGDEGHVYIGASIIDPATLVVIPDTVFSLNRVWDRLIASGRAYGVAHQGGWCDVGTPEGIALAEAMLETRADG